MNYPQRNAVFRSAESIKIPLDIEWNFSHNSFFSSYLLNIIIITSRRFLNFITHSLIDIHSLHRQLFASSYNFHIDCGLPILSPQITKCEQWWHFMIRKEFFYSSFLSHLSHRTVPYRTWWKESRVKNFQINIELPMKKENWFC